MPNWIKRPETLRDALGHYEGRTIGEVRCDCGETVRITHDGVECGKCAQPFNLFGQMLRRDHRLVTAYGEAADYLDEG